MQSLEWIECAANHTGSIPGTWRVHSYRYSLRRTVGRMIYINIKSIKQQHKLYTANVNSVKAELPEKLTVILITPVFIYINVQRLYLVYESVGFDCLLLASSTNITHTDLYRKRDEESAEWTPSSCTMTTAAQQDDMKAWRKHLLSFHLGETRSFGFV